jgi:HEPN domain-containing protein
VTDLADDLWRRARRFLHLAEREFKRGDTDVAVFLAHQAAELALKSALQTLGMDLEERDLKEHSLTALLGHLYRRLDADARERVGRFAGGHQRELQVLLEAYTEARYGRGKYDRETAEELVRTARSVVELVDGLVRRRGA